MNTLYFGSLSELTEQLSLKLSKSASATSGYGFSLIIKLKEKYKGTRHETLFIQSVHVPVSSASSWHLTTEAATRKTAKSNHLALKVSILGFLVTVQHLISVN